MPTPHQQVEAELTADALSLPETDLAPGWTDTRYLRVRGKGFAVFGATGEAHDALTLTFKLPISYEMVQDLPFVRQGSPWYRRNRWAIAHFGPDDDILAERDTLRGWLRQSYVAMAPQALIKLLPESGG
ncbi:MAG: MmcQ/YjbR family DNA-binding protein [Phenylobacterium sp.]|uniref:MmcQ/YjbR family DNA-binding protein n=1 Tax=Phenylobacterium sp. TaxID=1871053 RepID=UPI001B536CA5|nr:MmcQ/YjbR family DNA-binding protein [Phenylobacterium sp.]MBP7817784.1 MmcQ/YjbR family DNA-binding protein [Phenylobacterium sp.]MBP9230395.1 MmcQ/YjbR family DNA-binding protein [Phenylobacterium sp.]MBP9756205.1 MmcQ/YjbR family DNA-binding protein [Phenylobacterium sp.]